MKSNIFSRNSNILVASSIQVFINFSAHYCFHSEIQCFLRQFQHSSCKYYSSLSTFSIMLFHSFIRKSNIFFQQLIPTRFPFVHFHFDSRDLLRELKSLHSPIISLILGVIPVWKHFNFIACMHAYICMFHVRLKNHHNIFLARPMGPIYVKQSSVGHIFVKHHLVDLDATKIEK